MTLPMVSVSRLWNGMKTVLRSRPRKLLFPVAMAVLFLAVPASHEAGSPKGRDATDAAKRIAAEKRFFQRAIEDVNGSLSFVSDTIVTIENQIDAMEFIGSESREEDIRNLLDWYRNYAAWLEGKSGAFEADLNRIFSGETARTGWTDRYGEMTNEYQRLEGQLREKVSRLEKDGEKLEESFRKQQSRLEHLILRVEEEEKDEKESSRMWQSRLEHLILRADEEEKDGTESVGKRREKPDDPALRMEKGKKDEQQEGDRGMTKEEREAEISRLKKEILVLGNMGKHLDVLIELGQNELDWISLKVADCAVLNDYAKVVGSAAAPALKDAYTRVIRTYESDVSTLNKKIGDLDRQRSRLARSVSLGALDRAIDLAEHFEQMKSRYEHHISWLRQQIGGYQADLTGVFRASDRKTVSFYDLIQEIKAIDIIVIGSGEVQNSPENHRLDIEIIRALRESGAPLVIGLEMFRADSQKLLDAWVEGTLPLDRFLSVYSDNVRVPWPLFQDLFLYAREHRIPLVGLNIPDKIARTVSRSGFGWLSEDERKQLPPGISCNVDPKYMKFIKRAYAGHDRDSGRSFLNFCEAQMVRDKSMAWYLVEYMDKEPGRIAVVLAGVGHAWRRGIPEQVAQQAEFTSRAILPLIPGHVDPETVTLQDTDYVLLP